MSAVMQTSDIIGLSLDLSPEGSLSIVAEHALLTFGGLGL